MVGWNFLDFVFYCRSITSRSFLLLKEFAGLSAVVRDCRGKVVLAGCSLGGRGLSSQCAEAKAMCFGLSIVLEAVNLVISKSHPYFEIDLFIMNILNLLEFPSVCGVSYSHRSTNTVAHSFAKLAFSFSSESIWVAEFPHSVESFISADLVGL
ncbi:hypothetical protein ACOSQ4_029188 [Xanthoceras sorbifolium]